MAQSVSVTEEQLAHIAVLAEVLRGEALPAERAMILAQMAAENACAFCNRADIPAEMEQAVARVMLELENPCEDVSRVQRGDTAVTYRSAQGGVQAVLRPFCRLGTVGEDEV